MPLATPLQGFRVKNEKQASFVRLRLRDEPFTVPIADKTSQGPPRLYLASRKHERLKDVDGAGKVTDIFFHQEEDSGEDA